MRHWVPSPLSETMVICKERRLAKRHPFNMTPSPSAQLGCSEDQLQRLDHSDALVIYRPSHGTIPYCTTPSSFPYCSTLDYKERLGLNDQAVEQDSDRQIPAINKANYIESRAGTRRFQTKRRGCASHHSLCSQPTPARGPGLYIPQAVPASAPSF
jgi:hypothetical protein